MQDERSSRPCGPGAHSRAFQKPNLRLRRHSHISTRAVLLISIDNVTQADSPWESSSAAAARDLDQLQTKQLDTPG